MDLARYASPPHDQLRRTIAVRAMRASGSSVEDVRAILAGFPHDPSAGQNAFTDLDGVHPEVLIAAAAPVLLMLAQTHGYERLAVFGSVARGESTAMSDIDLLVQPPEGTSTFTFLRFKHLLERTLGTSVDLVSYGSLRPEIDGSILRDATLL